MSGNGAGGKKKPDGIKEMRENCLIDERYEIIEGVRYDFLSSPKYAHQRVLQNLHLAFEGACSADGEVMIAPLDVHLDENNIFQPDVIYVAADRLHIIRDGFVFGVPDLVVEILSDSTAKRDKTIKKNVYERFGVKEYWLTEPIYRTVDQFVLKDGRYDLVRTWTDDDILASPTIPCLQVDLSNIFPEDPRQ